MCGANASRWEHWAQQDILEKWNWLQILCLYPRRRPALEGTEELSVPKTDEIEDELPGSLDGSGGEI